MPSPPRSVSSTLRRSNRVLGLVYVLAAAVLCPTKSSAYIEESSTSLRNGEPQYEWKRQHILHSIHGNPAVRQAVSDVEDRMERSSTGVNGDPNHIVPYENHPYDKTNRNRRQLQDTTATNTTDKFQPMRIVFETKSLDNIRDSSNAAKIDWFKSVVLPKTAEFWSQTLSVVPVSGNLKISSAELDNRQYCGDSEFTEVPDEHIATGVPNADLILYVSGSDSSIFCPRRTLAVAVPCNFDNFDRPTAGAVNVCLDEIMLNDDGTAPPEVLQDYMDVAIHEVAHVLGMSSNSYRFFWDPKTGEPRTARPFSSRTVTCVDGRERTLILPDDNTMTFTETDTGRRYASIITPKVRAVARNQFDCQELEGAQLENQPTRSDSCTGDHWDESLYYPESMSGVISPTTNVLSSLTLALMEDSGWYRADYGMSRMSTWGLGAGCDFVNEPCLTKTDSGSEIPEYSKGYFCNNQNEEGCSSELTHKQGCTVIDYQYLVPQNLPPDQFQWFPTEPTKGGPRQADFCPVFGSPTGNKATEKLDCTNSGNGDTLRIFSEVYGAGSKCITTTKNAARCYETACIQDDMTFQIRIAGEWKVCENEGDTIDVTVGTLVPIPQTLVCPRLTQACPDLFCPFNCAGRGICNYDNIVNGTARPRCECFDETDTSLGCSDSEIPDGGFLEDSTGLFDNLEENFFDPLLAVFVDHPDKWTTASWAWAAGLIVVFLVLLLCICSSFWPQRKRKL